MSLINTFNTIINNRPTAKINEIRLVDDLISAIKQVYGKKCVAIKAHQNYAKFNGIKKELCDILLILKFKNHYRFSFIQNKINKKVNYKGLGRFKVNIGQHYLLTEKPIIQFKDNQSNILQNCQYETITDYAVFYKNANGQYDCDLCSSHKVCPLSVKEKQNLVTKRKKSKTINHCFSATTLISQPHKLLEGLSYVNLDDIENNPYFGEPIFFPNIHYSFNSLEIETHSFISYIVNRIIKENDVEIDVPQWLYFFEDHENFLERGVLDEVVYLNIKNLVILNCEKFEE